MRFASSAAVESTLRARSLGLATLLGAATIALGACSNTGSTTSSGSGGAAATGSSSGSHTSASGATAATGTSSGTQSATASGATTGSGSATTGSGGMAKADCATAAECKLEDDCCACAGYPATSAPPMCALTCIANQCAVEGYKMTLACVLGRCVAGFDCDQTKVACGQPTPMCSAGQTPSVVNGCWGPCVRADQCAAVGACSQCAANQACVFYGGGLKSYHCIDVPPVCGGTPSCACLGQSVCGSVPCADSGTSQLTCQAP